MADFFAVFLPALLLPDFFEIFFAFFLAVFGGADFLAFLTTFATAFTGAVLAADFLTRLTMASAAECQHGGSANDQVGGCHQRGFARLGSY